MLTQFQTEVARLLAQYRHEGSYFGGGTLLNLQYPRRSADFDLFHDDMQACIKSFIIDIDALRQHGYAVSIERSPEKDFFGKAMVSKDGHMTEIDWLHDSAFRFFPVERHEQTGFALNYHDVAINKILALAGRREVRDYYDLCTLIQREQPVIAYLWAACGKDTGYTPLFLLDTISHHSSYQQDEFNALLDIDPAQKISVQECKKLFVLFCEEARQAFAYAPLSELGCLYLTPDSHEVFFPSQADFTSRAYVTHYARVFGALPDFSDTSESFHPEM